MRRPREAILVFLLVGVSALAALGWVLHDAAQTGRTRVGYEDQALADLRALSKAQAELHAAKGHYGWVDELDRQGLLQGLLLTRDPQTGPGEGILTDYGYRLDVMLPHTVTRSGHVVIALRSEGKRNPELENRFHIVVARPWGDALTGFRTFALDEKGRVYVSEGVSDETSRTTRPLPELHLTRGGGVTVSGGLRWYPLDDLPKR